MLSDGAIVSATVSDVDTYGIRFVHDGISILVLIPELSWHSNIRDCRDFASVGQSFDVSILRYVGEKNLYLGSLKRVHSEMDPWQQADWLVVDRVVSGIVSGKMIDNAQAVVGYYVDVAPGIRTLLRAAKALGQLVEGESITARILHINRDDRKVEVEQVAQDHVE